MRSTLEDLKLRRSCKNFVKGKHIPDEDLDAILSCGTFAPTGRGLQSPKIVAVSDEETVKALSRLNAEILGMGDDYDPFYGATTVVIVFADSEINTYIEDGSLVLGNLLNATFALGYGGCWIHRAREMFETKTGKAFMKKWGIADKYKGIGNCVIGYKNAEPQQAKPRKSDYILKV